jgi:phosphoglycolate phosphatase
MDVSPSRQAVLFDLDGTLTDPFVGITKSLRYALEKLGRIAPAAEELRWCIGPPIQSAFAVLLETEDASAIDEGVRLYRERYSVIGKFENALIEGIPEALDELMADGFFLSVATSKPKTYAGDIIDYFDLRRYFNVVHGSELDGQNAVKAELISHVLATEPIEARRTVMIGDRSHDVFGANANGIAAIGVLWGYGERQELEGAGAARIIAGPAELRRSIGAVLHLA